MGFVGNKGGPRKSVIASQLGAAYFGISESELAEEIEIYIEEEYHGEIDPVRIDEEGRVYLIFYGPEKKLQNFYLDTAGYNLKGTIKAIINDEEKEIEL